MNRLLLYMICIIGLAWPILGFKDPRLKTIQIQQLLKILEKTEPMNDQHVNYIIKLMQPLLQEVSNVDVQSSANDGGTTPLLVGVMANNINFVKYLLQRGANPNFNLSNIGINRPIFEAHTYEMGKVLHEAGAEINNELTSPITLPSDITYNANLLHHAILCPKKLNLFNYYIKQGLSPAAKNSQGGNLWHTLVDNSLYCTKESFTKRARKLHELGLSPHQNKDNGKPATDRIQQFIINMENSNATNNPLYSEFKYFLSIIENPKKHLNLK